LFFRPQTIVVRQLTVGEVADFFDHAQGMTITEADILMDRTVPAQVVVRACGLTTEDLTGDVLPSELAALWDAVEAENSFFCAAMTRLVKAAGSLVEKGL